MSDVTMPEFDQWADDYLRRKYFFYDGKTALSLTNPLRAQLKEAWNAGQESKSTPMCTDGDLAVVYKCEHCGGIYAEEPPTECDCTFGEANQKFRECFLIDAKQGGK